MQIERFDELFDEHAQKLYGFLVYRTGDPALAEDVVADTFERALRSRKDFDPSRGSERGWLYAIALNRLRDVQRRATTGDAALERLGDGETGHAEDFSTAVIQHSDLGSAMAALPEAEREAIALRYGGDLTFPEIAELLAEPVDRIEGRVYRGLRRLRSILAP
jgi:RNA polymerase sigma-70 factor (ECF subfamily)